MDTTDRSVGCLLGLACGDALGRPVAGLPSRAIRADYGHLTEMRGNGVHGRPAGTVTAATRGALDAARSLLDCGAVDAADLTDRLLAWDAADGDVPPGVDDATAAVLARVRDGGPPEAVTADDLPQRTRNGALARCVPTAPAFLGDRDHLASAAADTARLTHSPPRCVESGVAVAVAIASLLAGEDGEAALAAARDVATARGAPGDLRTTLSVATDRGMATLDTGGSAVGTVETALHDALTAGDLEEAVVTAVNRGGDAPTVGAVTGGLAGARFGADAVPPRWLDALSVAATARDLGESLVALDPA